MESNKNAELTCHLSPYRVRYTLSDFGPGERISAIWAACEASARAIAVQIHAGCRILDIQRESPPQHIGVAFPQARFINGQFCVADHGDEADLHEMTD